MDSLKGFDVALAVLAVIAGLIGGCGMASYQVLSGKQFGAYILTAYAILGGCLGFLSFVVVSVVSVPLDANQVILVSGLIGAGGTASIAILRIGITTFLSWKGVDIKVSLHDKKRDCDE